MPDHEEFTSLEALPPFVGDAGVAAALFRDIAASLGAHHGGVHARAVEVGEAGRFQLRERSRSGSPVDAQHAPLAAPELFDGTGSTGQSDVYAAACLALTRYLGSSPVPAVPLAKRTSTRVRLAAVRQAHRTLPARLGAMPDPFRTVFALAVAKPAFFRPTPAQVVERIDAAFAALGPDAMSDARARAHRLVVLARVFQPLEAPPSVRVPALVGASAAAPLHLSMRARPAFARQNGLARGVLIAAVAVVATGGVVVAAAVGLGAGTPRTPQADSTLVSTPSPSGSEAPVAATSSLAPASPKAATTPGSTPPAGGVGPAYGGDNGGSGSGYDGGSDNGGGSGYGGGSGNGGGNSGGGGNGGGSQPAPPASQPARTPTPTPTRTVVTTAPVKTPTSTPPTTEPPTTEPPTTEPPTTEPPSSDPASSSAATTVAAAVPTSSG